LAKFFTDAFVELTGDPNSIVEVANYQTGDQDFSSQLLNISAKNPDVIFAPGDYNQVALLIKQARQLGIKAPFMGGDTFDAPEFFQIGGDDVEGVRGLRDRGVDRGTPGATRQHPRATPGVPRRSGELEPRLDSHECRRGPPHAGRQTCGRLRCEVQGGLAGRAVRERRPLPDAGLLHRASSSACMADLCRWGSASGAPREEHGDRHRDVSDRPFGASSGGAGAGPVHRDPGGEAARHAKRASASPSRRGQVAAWLRRSLPEMLVHPFGRGGRGVMPGRPPAPMPGLGPTKQRGLAARQPDQRCCADGCVVPDLGPPSEIQSHGGG